MIYQHWIGTLTLDRADEEAAPRTLDVWLPAEAPLRASRFERETWGAVLLAELLAPGGGRFAGTVEYWYVDEDDDE